MAMELNQLCNAWEEWATSSDQSEDGWQSDFPLWKDLISSACAAMIDKVAQKKYLHEIELCWRVSEETENMADFAKEHIRECWEVLVFLTKSRSDKVRWQVYSILQYGGRLAEPLLRIGLDDPDSYCKRRAIMALAQLHPIDSDELRVRFMCDADPYIRQVAQEFNRNSA